MMKKKLKKVRIKNRKDLEKLPENRWVWVEEGPDVNFIFAEKVAVKAKRKLKAAR